METPPRVIKAESIRELGHKLVFDFEDFQQRCNEQVSSARQQAGRVLSQAQTQAQSIQEQARTAGRKEGYREGMKQAEAEIESRAGALAQEMLNERLNASLSSLEAMAQSLTEARTAWLTRWETLALELCIAISEKIIRSELAHRPQLGQAMIRELMEIASSGNRLVAKLHPGDVQSIQEAAGALEDLSRFHEAIELRGDPGLDRGDCIIESEHGRVDGRVKTQLDRIFAELVPEDQQESHAAP